MASSPRSHRAVGGTTNPEHADRPSDTASDGSDHSIVKKPAWSKPLGGGAVSAEVGPVMGGAVSWPALSESARSSPRTSTADLPKDPSPPPLLISSPTKKSSTGDQNPNSVKIHRQKSMRGGVGGVDGPPSSRSSTATVNGAPGMSSEEQSPTEVASVEPVNKNSHNGDHGFRGAGAGNHRSHSGGGRRGSNGGNGPHHNSSGHRRDHEWGHRSFNSRDGHMQPVQHPRGGGTRSYPRPVPAQPVVPPFIAPPPLQGQPFGPPIPPMGFPDVNAALYPMAAQPPTDAFGGMPFIAHAVPPALFYPAMDSSHRTALLKQIDYYFSTGNLCKDIYLRQKMDDQGWVPISLIAGFNKVKQLTNNIHYILDTVQYSTVVEVQGDKIRRRNDWMNWVLPPPDLSSAASSVQAPATPDYDDVLPHFNGVSIQDRVVDNSSGRVLINAELALSRSSSGNLNDQSPVYGDANGQVSGYMNSDLHAWSTRSLSRSDTL